MQTIPDISTAPAAARNSAAQTTGTASTNHNAPQWQTKRTTEQLKAARIWSVGRNLIDNHGEDHQGKEDDISFTLVAPQ
jgi:hypothetical protein